jgi:hypothetical protein
MATENDLVNQLLNQLLNKNESKSILDDPIFKQANSMTKEQRQAFLKTVMELGKPRPKK